MSPKAAWLLQEEIVPRLTYTIPSSVRCVGSEDALELVQDGITMAARMLDRVESQGKLGKVSGSNIAYYTVQHLKSGRRANGTSSVDIMGSSTQLNGSSKLHSLNEVVAESEAGDEIFELQDVISQDEEDPGTKATRKLDWETFMAGLDEMEVLVVDCLCNGTTLRKAGRKVGLSDSSMQNHRRKLAEKLLEFMGFDILKDIAQIPGWRISLDCERELMACRADRRH